MTTLVLGVDPGFASTGFALMRLGARPEDDGVVRLGVIWTEPSAKKRKVLAADDNARRGRELARALHALLEEPLRGCPLFVPGARVVLAAAEAMSYPRNAASAAKMAICWGVLLALLDRRALALAQASPQEVKRAVAGTKSAAKEQVRDALWERFGRSHLEHLLLHADVPGGEREHAYDALASIVASLDSDLVRALRTQAA